ncbi:hypothetical protein HWB90_gp072 [Mycobacterium phage Fowlmouth]|uniref:Uncharacterized protein n=1 Tax=Mycobacterium phage Fowlmouth TaxID=2419978 RepID=A0A3G2KGI2_9CAUD|nr:hypothetical protein HWB90_gp072 [Mycobacterium phage Fowlmouth]AYN58067.1 hypothetical protein SEA_FOWLMOUTH_118 [Mycobacterium phage Fowlmouth]
MPAPPCKPNCMCGKHFRTREHNRRIGESVKERQLQNLKEGKPINQFKREK